MSDTNDPIRALLEMGAALSRDEEGKMVAEFNGPINTEVDENKHKHLRIGSSTVNFTAHGYEIVKSEITLSPL